MPLRLSLVSVLLALRHHQSTAAQSCMQCLGSLCGGRCFYTGFSSLGFSSSAPDTNRPPAVGERPACTEERRNTALVPAAMKCFIVHDSLPRIAGQLAPWAHEIFHQTYPDVPARAEQKVCTDIEGCTAAGYQHPSPGSVAQG